jgi:hypothetical protein
MGVIFCKAKSLNPGADPVSFLLSWMRSDLPGSACFARSICRKA